MDALDGANLEESPGCRVGCVILVLFGVAFWIVFGFGVWKIAELIRHAT